jgi:DNA-binding CsgD family transcriptional regulator
MVRGDERWPAFGSTAVRLSRRERDILAAAARGMSTSEVAAELGLEVDDVRGAMASAIGKLGARSKLEAILIAVRSGEIDLDP